MRCSSYSRRRLALIGALLLMLQALPVIAAGFDCAKASTRVEILICTDPELSRLDDDQSAAYRESYEFSAKLDEAARKARSRSANSRRQVRDIQREWLHFQRNSCETAACLKAEYAAKLTEFKAPQRSDRDPFETSSTARELPAHVYGRYTVSTRETAWNPDRKKWVEGDLVEDFVEIAPDTDGKAKVSLSLGAANGGGCGAEGIAQWRENHLWLYRKRDTDDRVCRLRLYSDGRAVLLRDLHGNCTVQFCSPRGWIDRSRLTKAAP